MSSNPLIWEQTPDEKLKEILRIKELKEIGASIKKSNENMEYIKYCAYCNDHPGEISFLDWQRKRMALSELESHQ